MTHAVDNKTGFKFGFINSKLIQSVMKVFHRCVDVLNCKFLRVEKWVKAFLACYNRENYNLGNYNKPHFFK